MHALCIRHAVNTEGEMAPTAHTYTHTLTHGMLSEQITSAPGALQPTPFIQDPNPHPCTCTRVPSQIHPPPISGTCIHRLWFLNSCSRFFFFCSSSSPFLCKHAGSSRWRKSFACLILRVHLHAAFRVVTCGPLQSYDSRRKDTNDEIHSPGVRAAREEKACAGAKVASTSIAASGTMRKDPIISICDPTTSPQ
jgi:hypothetical protein